MRLGWAIESSWTNGSRSGLLLRRICGIYGKQFSTPYLFSGWAALPDPCNSAGNANRWAVKKETV